MPSPAPRNVLIVSLGCAKNLVDTEVMCGALAMGGYALTNLADEADVMLVNTCSFIADARAEAMEEIRAATRWRKQVPSRRLVVAGCLPQRDLAEVSARFAAVDLFLGLDDVPRVAALLDTLYQPRGKPRDRTAFDTPSYIYDSHTPRLQLTPRNYAYVKIAEGCDHRCTFCAIPGIRGPQRSRPVADIVAECAQLLANGVRELNFIAQDSSRYGADRDDGATLAKLIATCEECLTGDFWLRILYTHPRHFDDALIETYRVSPHLTPYVDIPLQHISSTMLKRMGRRMDETETRRLLARLRDEISGVVVRTTFLVGFPGETDADFACLKRFVENFQFDRLGVFVYSPEKGTPAATIADGRVDSRIAEARRDELMALQRDISWRRNQMLVGKTATVLVEGVDADGQFVGRGRGDAPEVDNLIVFSGPEDCFERGFVEVEIQSASDYDLVGVAHASHP